MPFFSRKAFLDAFFTVLTIVGFLRRSLIVGGVGVKLAHQASVFQGEAVRFASWLIRLDLERYDFRVLPAIRATEIRIGDGFLVDFAIRYWVELLYREQRLLDGFTQRREAIRQRPEPILYGIQIADDLHNVIVPKLDCDNLVADITDTYFIRCGHC
jgi:hypothetical protein